MTKLKSYLFMILYIVITVYIVYLLLLFIGQKSIIYPGTQRIASSIPPTVAGMQIWSDDAHGMSHEALYLPPLRTMSVRSPAVIFAHGNGEIVDDWLSGLDFIRQRGFAVVLVEYPGYGRLTNTTPSEDSIRSAMRAAYDRLVSMPETNPEKIIGYGRSLGGGVACQLASERKLAALILQSTFTSLNIFPQRYLAPSFLLHDHYDSMSVIKKFSAPVLIMHGIFDQFIPMREGEILAKNAKNALFHSYACDHNCQLNQDFQNDILHFLENTNR